MVYYGFEKHRKANTPTCTHTLTEVSKFPVPFLGKETLLIIVMNELLLWTVQPFHSEDCPRSCPAHSLGPLGRAARTSLLWFLPPTLDACTGQPLFPAPPVLKERISVFQSICYSCVAPFGPGNLEGRATVCSERRQSRRQGFNSVDLLSMYIIF